MFTTLPKICVEEKGIENIIVNEGHEFAKTLPTSRLAFEAKSENNRDGNGKLKHYNTLFTICSEKEKPTTSLLLSLFQKTYLSKYVFADITYEPARHSARASKLAIDVFDKRFLPFAKNISKHLENDLGIQHIEINKYF